MLITAISAEAQVPELLNVPNGLSESEHRKLSQLRAELKARLAGYQAQAHEFRTDCASVKRGSAEDAACAQRYGVLERLRLTYTDDATKFNARVRAAGSAAEGLPIAAADLVAAMNEVSKLPIFLDQRTGNSEDSTNPLPKGRPIDAKLVDNNCQTFFRALGAELARRQKPSWSKSFPLEGFGEQQADAIVAEIDRNAHAGPSSTWVKLERWEDAQKLANEGAVVIGGMRGNPHGHLAVVVPTPRTMDVSKFRDEERGYPGQGPFVRDGNEHLYEPQHRFHPSTWGAIPASRAMPLDKTSWYVWKPSLP